jgi:hypothetical protein
MNLKKKSKAGLRTLNAICFKNKKIAIHDL